MPAPPKRRRRRYATNSMYITSELVRRGSQSHQTPHALRAQSGPVTSIIVPNTTASSAAASAT